MLVYDDYLDEEGDEGPDRVITPFAPDGSAQVSVNLHGIVHLADKNALILSDVGDPGDATDGQLFVITGVNNKNGDVQVKSQFGGPNSQLGNPVDIAFDGQNLYVAEKSNALILRFDDILGPAGAGLDPVPSEQVGAAAPESVALLPEFLTDLPD